MLNILALIVTLIVITLMVLYMAFVLFVIGDIIREISEIRDILRWFGVQRSDDPEEIENQSTTRKAE